MTQHCTILLETKTRDRIRSIARKNQTYDEFIMELIDLKLKTGGNPTQESNLNRIATTVDRSIADGGLS